MGHTNVRFYYSFLNLAEKKIFDSIYAQLQKMQPEIRIMGTARTVKKILFYVLKDCPELFFVDNTSMQLLSDMGGVTVQMKYLKNHAEVKAVNQRLRMISDRFLKEIEKRQLDNRNTIRYVHDFILKNTEYARERLDRRDASGDVSTICGVFVDKRAVCMGISLAAKWLLDQAGIVSGVMEGCVTEDENNAYGNAADGNCSYNHAWNIVDVNDDWHYMDITMDIGASQNDKAWVSYDYFLRGDATMKKYVQYENPYVTCELEKYSFYVSHKVIFSGEKMLTKYLQYCVKKHVGRMYFQVEKELAQKSPDQIHRLVSQYLLFSAYQWRYNQKLNIYDFKVIWGRGMQ